MTTQKKRINLLFNQSNSHLTRKVKLTQAVLPGVIVGQLNWSNVIIVVLLSRRPLHKSYARQVAHESSICCN